MKNNLSGFSWQRCYSNSDNHCVHFRWEEKYFRKQNTLKPEVDWLQQQKRMSGSTSVSQEPESEAAVSTDSTKLSSWTRELFTTLCGTRRWRIQTNSKVNYTLHSINGAFLIKCSVPVFQILYINYIIRLNLFCIFFCIWFLCCNDLIIPGMGSVPSLSL